MGITIDVLALENWFDLLAFLSRAQLGQLAPRIGNRRFATIVQHFLHKYVRQISLRPINLLQMIHDGTENGRHSKARVIVWKSYRWGREEFPVADRPMPENITDFEAIHLSYLDISVLGFLQKLEQKSMFTNVNVKITTKYAGSSGKIMQCLFHLVPMIASVNSIEIQGAGFFDLIIHKNRYYFAECTQEQKTECVQVATRMIHMARIIEINNQYSSLSYGRYQFDWLCHWLYTPRDDRKARILILLQQYITPNDLPDLVERLKWDLLLAKEAVSYFIGIQTEPMLHVPPFHLESVTNCKTNERFVCKQGRVLNWPPMALISRYPMEAAQAWIDENEKEILERKVYKQRRRIELDGERIGIERMEMTNPPPSNSFRKLISNLKKIGK